MTNISETEFVRNDNHSTSTPPPESVSAWSSTTCLLGCDNTYEEVIDQILEWLPLFVPEGYVAELRALKVADVQFSVPQPRSGFFDAEHVAEMAKQALDVTQDSEGVYFTINPLNRDLLARRCNRVDRAKSGENATDKDVARRHWLLIDADPVRIGGVSATDGEKARALELVEGVREKLTGSGWPLPLLADSGNGYHLLYRIDLPVDDQELVKKVLAALADQFDTEAVKIDQKVFNPSRIVKLYGTKARKGDDTPERPHRWTKVLELPEKLEIVPDRLLEELAAKAPEVAKPRHVEPVKGNGYRIGKEEAKRRAAAYVATIPGGVSGNNGHDETFTAACKLVLGFGLSVDEALPIFEKWNETCQPPWSEKELVHKLRDADKKDDSRGYLLDSASSF